MSVIVTHGTTHAYTNQLCRCPLCCKAWGDYMKTWRAFRRAMGYCRLCYSAMAEVGHATCGECRRKNTAYMKARRQCNRLVIDL